MPVAPANFAADFAGGGLMCAFGIVMALYERHFSGLGQVVSANMMSGSAYAGSWLFRSRQLHLWNGPRGTNMYLLTSPFFSFIIIYLLYKQ